MSSNETEENNNQKARVLDDPIMVEYETKINALSERISLIRLEIQSLKRTKRALQLRDLDFSEIDTKISKLLDDIEVIKEEVNVVRKARKFAYNRIWERLNSTTSYRRGPYKIKEKVVT